MRDLQTSRMRSAWTCLAMFVASPIEGRPARSGGVQFWGSPGEVGACGVQASQPCCVVLFQTSWRLRAGDRLAGLCL